MSVPVIREPANMAGAPAEDCCLCKRPTRYWHEANNVALCRKCAATAKPEQIPTYEAWIGPIMIYTPPRAS